MQFPPVHRGRQTFLPSQANNLYIFPAVGIAIYATNAKRVTDEMFIESAHAVADQVTPEQLKLGMLLPPQSNILEVEIKTAARVAKLCLIVGLHELIVRLTIVMTNKANGTQQNGAQLVVRALEAQRVTHVFGIPGAKIDAVFNALVELFKPMGNSEAVCKRYYLETLTREEGKSWFALRRSIGVP